jgi:hypothetical protein
MAYTPWQNPDPQSIAGMNSVVVFGENFQAAVGLNHQLALGSNLQICVNPSVLADMCGVSSDTLASIWGSGPGGNQQFTIGSNTNVVWGRQFQVNLGPEQLQVNANAHRIVTEIVCGLIAVLLIVWIIVYGLEKDENNRANETIGFQIAVDILLALLLKAEMKYKNAEQTIVSALKGMFGAGDMFQSSAWQDFGQGLTLAVILGAMIAPVVAIATEEGHFQGQTQDAQFGLSAGNAPASDGSGSSKQ